MKDKIYLSDMPMLFFQNLPSGFVAAFKQFWDLPKIVKANNLTTPNHFIILPRGFMPDLGIPYLAKTIELDERIPRMVLGKKTFYRYDATDVMRADKGDILQHFSEPGKHIRLFRVFNGGKK